MNATLRVQTEEPLGLPPASSEQTSRDALVTLLGPTLSRLALRYERDRRCCSELQQDLLIALWLMKGSSELRVSFRSWVSSFAQHENAPEVVAVERRERAALLLVLLDNLRPKEREAVLLNLQSFEPSEIATALDCSPAQTQEVLLRAQRRLQDWMKRRGDQLPEPVLVSFAQRLTR